MKSGLFYAGIPSAIAAPGPFVGGALTVSLSGFSGNAAVKLLTPSTFSLQLLGSYLSDEMPRSEIILNGKRTGKTLDGAILEAALRHEELILIFVTNAVLYEDTLRIYLLDTGLEVLDQACLGGMYVTGTFSLLEVVPPDTVRFVFFGGTEWTLKILAHKTLRLPMSDPHGASRPCGLYRRFSLHCTPKPEPV